MYDIILTYSVQNYYGQKNIQPVIKANNEHYIRK